MWDQLLSAEFWISQGRQILARAVEAAVGIAWALLLLGIGRWLVLKSIDALLRSVPPGGTAAAPEARLSRTRTLAGLLRSVANYTLIFIAGVMILEKFGLNVAAVLTGAGVAGLAVGFGSQKLVRDVIAGFFILLEDQFAVGDTITAGGSTGTVVEMGMRITRLRDDTGKLIILSNGDITTVVNHSRGPLLAAVDVNVAPTTDLSRVREIVEAIGRELSSRDGLLAGAPSLRGVTALDGTKMTLRIVAQAQPGRQQDVEMALRAALLEQLSAADVRIV